MVIGRVRDPTRQTSCQFDPIPPSLPLSLSFCSITALVELPNGKIICINY